MEIDFCKPGVIQWVVLNFNFCFVSSFNGRYLSRIKLNFFKKHSTKNFILSLMVITSKLILVKFNGIQDLQYFLKETKNLYQNVTEWAYYLVCLEFEFHLYHNTYS